MRKVLLSEWFCSDVSRKCDRSDVDVEMTLFITIPRFLFLVLHGFDREDRKIDRPATIIGAPFHSILHVDSISSTDVFDITSKTFHSQPSTC